MTRLMLAVLLVMGCAGPAHASLKEDVKKGNVLYTDGQYAEAVKAYRSAASEDPGEGIPHFNLGAALYRKGDYAKDVAAYNRAIATGDPLLIAKAAYNLEYFTASREYSATGSLIGIQRLHEFDLIASVVSLARGWIDLATAGHGPTL